MRNQSGRKLPNWAIGAIMLAVLAVASYVAFTKQVPWGGGTEFTAVFNSAQNLRPNSPVRIAGVEVGKVTSVEPVGGNDASSETYGVQSGALVTMEIDDEGLPLKEDATFKLRPRLFLEGNLFVDVRPGSPAAPAVDSDFTFPAVQTSNSVQLDEVLSGALQADARKDLQIFLDQFGKALIDEGGAKSLRALNEAAPDAFKYASQVNQAFLGENPHDLSSLIGNLDRVVRGLGANEDALTGLITNLRVTTGSFAAESVALERAIQELPDTLDAGQTAFTSLNGAFPAMRAFAREALPGVRSTPSTLEVTNPLLRQLRGLAQPAELRGLVADLRPTVPKLALLTRRTIPFLRQARELSSCFNNVILPWANDKIYSTDPNYQANLGPFGKVFEETGYGLAGISGESRSGDANGQYVRVIAGGGTNTIQGFGADGEPNGLAGLAPLPIEGAMPAIEDSAKTKFKPEEPCENQDPPNLGATGMDAPEGQSTPPTGAALMTAQAEAATQTLGEAVAAAEQDPDSAETKQLTREARKLLKDAFGGEAR